MLEPGSTTMPLSESFVFRCCCCSFSIEEEEKEFLKPPDKHRAAEGTIRWYEVDVVVAPSISLVVRHILRKEEESARRIFTCKVISVVIIVVCFLQSEFLIPKNVIDRQKTRTNFKQKVKIQSTKIHPQPSFSYAPQKERTRSILK